MTKKAKPDWSVFLDNLDEPPISLDERVQRIAAVLRSGSPSEKFCKALANMMVPGSKNAFPWTVTFKRKKTGRPTADDRIAIEMQVLVDCDAMSPDVAVAVMQQRHGRKGFSRSTCLQALERGREIASLDEFYDRMVAQARAKGWIASPEN